MVFALILIQKLLCYYSEIFNGTRDIPSTYITMAKELSFGKIYWYRSKKWPYLFFLKQNQLDKNKIDILVLALPFTADQLRNDQIRIRKDIFFLLLEKFFTLINIEIFKAFWLIRINFKADEYINFNVFENIKIILKLSNNKVYFCSNFNLLEFIADKSIFNKL